MKKGALVFTVMVMVFPIGACSKDDEDLTAQFEGMFSAVYKEFGRAALSGGGAIEIEDCHKGGSWNTKTRRGSNQFRGIVKVTGGVGHCGEVLEQVKKFITSRTQMYSTEGDLPKSLDGTEKHAYTVWMYNMSNRHGELRMWLFPYPDSNRVGFAVHHYEEDLK